MSPSKKDMDKWEIEENWAEVREVLQTAERPTIALRSLGPKLVKTIEALRHERDHAVEARQRQLSKETEADDLVNAATHFARLLVRWQPENPAPGMTEDQRQRGVFVLEELLASMSS